MKRLAIGAALGGLAVYLYDPELGENRRGRLSALWQENRNGALRAGRTASETLESARPLARSITKAIRHGNWAPAPDRGRPVATLTRLIGAAAVGGAVVYFLDPVEGSARRLLAVERARTAVRQIANIVERVNGPIGDRVTDAVESVKSKVS
jgi:hypothetical protein